MGTHKNYPYEIKDVDSEESKEIFKYFTEGYQEGFVRIGPKGYFLTNGFRADAANVYHLPLRRDDVFVMSIPKSGTTWTQELVWMIANDFDYLGSNSATLPSRFPFLEQSLLFNSGKAQKKMRTEFAGNERLLTLLDAVTTPGSVMAEKIPSPRFLKTHLALSLLPPRLLDEAKVVYVARDPRDVAVSYYHHDKLFSFMGFTGDFRQFWECFVKGRLDWTPYFPHVLEAWEQRNHPNFLFMFYEDMLKDLPAAVRRVADFLGKSVSDEEMTKLCTHLSFNNFKNNNMVNFECTRVLGWLNESKSFVRKGKSGGWREYFDEEMSAQAQRWIDDNLRGSGLRFPNQ